MTNEFEKLGIGKELLKAIEDMGFEKPTEIQEKSIPLIMEGKDVIAKASTGSGKTLAFGSRIIEHVKKDFGIQALVLAPTRELAEQISKELRKFSKYKKLRVTPIYGGVSFNPQKEDLEYAEIVVGTPGRILDHLSRDTIELKHLKILVLDEADRMLDMGFIDDVEKIISQCPKERQTLLFSATISQDISRLSHKYMKNEVEVEAEEYVDPSLLTQVYYDVEDNLKFSLLAHLLKSEEAKLVMVFCNTRKNVDFVANNLDHLGIEALPIHGGFSQDKRTRIMERFHSQTTHVLVCTDIAARGLDIKGVSHVYNYNMPNDSKEYVHRIGRTARAGKEGKVINLVSSRDHENFRSVLRNDSLNIQSLETPQLERIPIKWIPEGRRGRNNGRDRGDRGNSRGFGRRDSRPSYGRSNSGYRSRDDSRGEDKIGRRSSFGSRDRDEGRGDRRPSRGRDDDRPSRGNSRGFGRRDSRTNRSSSSFRSRDSRSRRY